MKLPLKFLNTLLILSIFIIIQKNVEAQFKEKVNSGGSGDKKVVLCHSADEDGILIYGTYCFSGTSRCIENPCQ